MTTENEETVSPGNVFGGVSRIEDRRIGDHHNAKRHIVEDEDSEQVAGGFDIDFADLNRSLAYYDHPDEMRTVESQRSAMPDGLRVVPGQEDFDGPEGPEPEA